jgi:ankyrin repeat protein
MEEQMTMPKAQQSKNDALFAAVRNDGKLKNGNVQGVHAAIADGADVNARFGDENFTILQIAARWKNLDATKELLKIPTLDINAQDNDGWTALHSATRLYFPEFVEVLLKHPSIKVDIKNGKEQTPWDMARHDVTGAGNKIRSLLASKEGTTWEEGEQKRGRRAFDYSHTGEARLR